MKKLTVIGAFLGSLFALPTLAHDGYPTYQELKERAIFECPRKSWEKIDEGIIDTLIAIEKQFDVHGSVRGMVLAAGCLESGFNPKALGDRKFSKDKKTPKAFGVLQLWKFYEKAYGVDRLNAESSARGWLTHIIRMLPKVKKQCKHRTPEKIWVAAWVTGIRSKKAGGRCNEKPKHLKLLRKWQREIRKARELPKGNCGC
tara:strand:- start:3708 stop:4310 length:603 start_codon:yes stop_codon:yes gene_type:complete